jgi:xanthine/uracil/vitamin C permease (AzgA family)
MAYIISVNASILSQTGGTCECPIGFCAPDANADYGMLSFISCGVSLTRRQIHVWPMYNAI